MKTKTITSRLITIFVALLTALANAATEPAEGSDAVLTQLAAEKRMAIIALNVEHAPNQFQPFLGVFISGDGLGLINLASLGRKEKPKAYADVSSRACTKIVQLGLADTRVTEAGARTGEGAPPHCRSVSDAARTGTCRSRPRQAAGWQKQVSDNCKGSAVASRVHAAQRDAVSGGHPDGRLEAGS